MNAGAHDAAFMAHAIRLAERGLYTTDPNPRVGCVIVRAGRVVGEGWHARAGEPHAEVHALRAAGEAARGATAYVTLEPCCHHGRTPPCIDALIEAGVTRVVAAMTDPDPRVAGQGLARLKAAGIAVEDGVLAEAARALNPGFISRHTRARPYVRLKLAASLDGRTALANGESRWITGDAARNDVQRFRARSSAIVTGIGTVRADDPALNARLPDATRQPLRVVVDSRLDTPPGARVLARPGECLIAAAVDDAARAQRLREAGARVGFFPAPDARVDLRALLAGLAAEGANEVWVEAGPRLAGAFMSARLIDELVLYFAPHVLGDSARGMFALPALTALSQKIALEIVDVRAVGADWRVRARVAGE